VAGERDVFLHLVEFAEVDERKRIFLALDDLGLQRGIDLAEIDADRRSLLNIEVQSGLTGTRILNPFRSAGVLIGCVLLVIWR
jgi:hypothetical protein